MEAFSPNPRSHDWKSTLASTSGSANPLGWQGQGVMAESRSYQEAYKALAKMIVSRLVPHLMERGASI
jgi:hypothetical protein